MLIEKRNGNKEEVDFNKVYKRIKTLSRGLDVEVHLVSKKTIEGLYNGIKSRELDILASELSATMAGSHPDYSLLAGRIAVSNLFKETENSFSKKVHLLEGCLDKKYIDYVLEHAEELDELIDYNLDYNLNYFSYRTLAKSYLLKLGGKIIERPQDMFLRVAVALNMGLPLNIKECYKYMSERKYTHATPTLFNAGLKKGQLSSCFLMGIDNSVEGMYEGLKKAVLISKRAGGLGIHGHNISAKGSPINNGLGESNGIVPLLRTYNEASRHINQGGRRPGSFAIYLETWHKDIFDFLDLKKNHGKEEMRARDLFYGLWVSDLFMNRVKDDLHWTLFCPSEAEGLEDLYGKGFEEKYIQYEQEVKGGIRIKARDLWRKIIDSQIETGTPYMCYKDTINRRSNQVNIGIIKSSNLCAEIVEYNNSEETATCNLASIGLPSFVKEGKMDWEELEKAVDSIVWSLNQTIDLNNYPVDSAKSNTLNYRPLGIGVQGLADVFFKLRFPFESMEARRLNKEIFERIYYYALKSSMECAIRSGAYTKHWDSPACYERLQFDLCGIEPEFISTQEWNRLKTNIRKNGLRNSLLIALMPTASTSQILGYNECFEPITSNLYVRRTSAGEFVVINKYLVKDLIELGLWNQDIKEKIIKENGSVQGIHEIPEDLRELYKTAYEIKQKSLINLAVDRGAYVCQSQSLNIFMRNANYSKLTAMHFYGWSEGLKTGMYYLRNTSSTDAIKITVDNQDCEMCSS